MMVFSPKPLDDHHVMSIHVPYVFHGHKWWYIPSHKYLRAVCIAVIIVIVLIVTKRIDDCCSDSLLQSKADDRST